MSIGISKKQQDVCAIDQACSVKLAGYWPSSDFCVFTDRDGVEVHKPNKLGQ